MNEQIHEQLSAFMDGELERDQTRFLLKRMTSDHGLPLRWSRYHVARQVLRRQEVMVVAGFSDAVMARLDHQAAIRVGGARSALRWGAGGAIAASVAVAALVLTRPVGDVSVDPALVARSAAPQTSTSPTQVATSSAPAEFRVPLLAPTAPVETAPASFGSTGFGGQMILVDPQAPSYLIRPYQAVGAIGQPGPVPYVLLDAPHVEAARAPSTEPQRQQR
jgi:sigma-E factor negative regulatory protein RseA